MKFPEVRLRRLRRSEPLRDLVRETRLHPGALIAPLFVCPGEGVRRSVASMPGVFNLSIDEAVREAAAAVQLGIRGFLLFGLPAEKDDQGSGAWQEDGIVQQALRAMRRERALNGTLLIADVCLCEYTTHGHCGVVQQPDTNGAFAVDNDASLPLIARTAVSLARAGADVIAPSDMMDGRVAAIRSALDAAQLSETPILSYAAKFSSAFYGPFRDAADSAPQFGDRRTYQMDSANRREAMREIAQDLAEGADMILMKPALPYLDVIRETRDRFDVPMGAYQVSGEYAMLQAAFQNGWLDRERAMLESLMSIRRAGADFIVTYFAQAAAKLL
jgi:porphobilinogen synthase